MLNIVESAKIHCVIVRSHNILSSNGDQEQGILQTHYYYSERKFINLFSAFKMYPVLIFCSFIYF